MNLYLVRHTESEGNANKAVYYQMPDWRVPLTEKGKQDALEVGKKLCQKFKRHETATIINSPYIRTKESAEIISDKLKCYFSPYGVEIIESSLIYEREWGNLREECDQFETREERSHLFDFFRRPEGGESFADVYKRAFTFLEYLKREFSYKDENHFPQNIIIVSHGEFLKVLLMIIDGESVEDFDTLPNIKNGEIIERRIYG